MKKSYFPKFSQLLTAASAILISCISINAQNPVLITATGAGNFTVPCGITSITVECWGAGGGGGGDNTNNTLVSNGGGGGGGGYCTTVMAVTPGQVIAYNIGAGGTAGAAAAGGAGGTGGNTNFGTVIANGGNGGQGSAGTSLGGTGGGGSGGTVTNGNVGITGITLGGAGGNGASGGAGGAAAAAGSNGNNGAAPGGGGSGGYRSGATNRAGGAGGNGQIRITLTGTVCGDDPCNAIVLPFGATCSYTSGSNVGATNTTTPGSPGCAGYSGGDIWYRVTVPPSGNLFIDSQIGINGILDGGMAVYSGASCSSLTMLQCDDDNSPNGAMPAITLTGQTPGSFIYIRFWENGNNVIGNFGICATSSSIMVPSNCQGAIAVCNNTTIPGASGGVGIQELVAGSNNGCLNTLEHQSTWFGFSPTSTGSIAFLINPTAGAVDYDFAIWGPYPPNTGCPVTGAPLRCSYASSTGSTGLQAGAGDLTEGVGGDRYVDPITIGAAQIGMIYYLLVDNFATNSTPFTLTWTLSPTNILDCTPPLPVEMGIFNGEGVGASNHIYWTTMSETNCDYFMLQKSPDGINYTNMERITGHGNSNTVINYDAFDSSPFDMTYYRLQQFDYNGENKLYGPIVISNNEAYGLRLDKVYPNPADESFTIEIYSQNHEAASLTIQVFDAMGRMLYQQPVKEEGKLNYQVNCSSWAPGIYSVKVSSDNHHFSEVRKVIIK